MTPESFELKVTIPGDARLLGAIRQLAAHAGEYAGLSPEARGDLAGHVERAAEAAVAASGTTREAVDVAFVGHSAGLDVIITCVAAPAAPTPASTTGTPLSVDWTRDSTRHTCRIRHRTSG